MNIYKWITSSQIKPQRDIDSPRLNGWSAKSDKCGLWAIWHPPAISVSSPPLQTGQSLRSKYPWVTAKDTETRGVYMTKRNKWVGQSYYLEYFEITSFFKIMLIRGSRNGHAIKYAWQDGFPGPTWSLTTISMSSSGNPALPSLCVGVRSPYSVHVQCRQNTHSHKIKNKYFLNYANQLTGNFDSTFHFVVVNYT